MSRRRRYKLPPPVQNLPAPCDVCAPFGGGMVPGESGATWCTCERGKAAVDAAIAQGRPLSQATQILEAQLGIGGFPEEGVN